MTPASTPEDNLDPEITTPDPVAQPDDDQEFGDLGSLLTSKGILSNNNFQSLPGDPGTAVQSDRYICPVPDCPTDWFRTRVGQTPPLCEDHGQVLVPEAPQP